MLHISAAQLPVSVTDWQLAANESGAGHSGSRLGVQNSNFKTGELVQVANPRSIYAEKV